jgi:hypothetical protein
MPDYSGYYIQLESVLSDRIQQSTLRFVDREKQKIQLRSEQQSRHYERKIRQQEQRIQTAKSNNRPPNVINGFQAQLDKLHAALDKELLRLDRVLGKIESQEHDVVAGLVDVTPTCSLNKEPSSHGK